MRLSLLSLSIATLAASAVTASVQAQLRGPAKSPHATVTQQVGLGEMVLDYSRPSMRDREVFGGLVPFDQVWRTGANASTKITFDQDATVGGEAVKAGTYAIYTIPKKDADWTFILSKNSKEWGSNNYDPANDALRIDVKPTVLPTSHETFTIDFDGFNANGANLFMVWDKMHISVPIVVDSETKMMKQIDERVRNAEGDVSARTYYDAAMYMMDKGKDLKEASMWMDKANEMQPGVFHMMFNQARLAKMMGDDAKATRIGTAALEAAKEAKNDFGYSARIMKFLEEMKG